MIGKILGHYQITEKLGEGGMGVVYKAHDTHLDRFVAIKTLPPERVADPERKRRFIQEAKAASALNHPNIITIHDIDLAEAIDFIAMEYVAGKTLDESIPRKGMRLSLALKYSVQIADALARAHGAGIIHRDLKPSNVMVDEHGLVKVLDFGLAKLMETSGPEARTMSTGTGEGGIVGTAAYMSPEQAEGKHIDTRSDIFSFGSMLYEMLTGQRAFQGETRASTIASILREDPKPISQVAEGLPREVERLVRRCLRKDPEHRFQHMSDLKVALEELKDESDSGTLEAGPAAKPSGHRRLIWALGLTVMLGIAAIGFWFLRSRRQLPEAPLAVVPLTSYPGEETSPSFSPDGNQVAFMWNGEKEDNYDIYVKQIKSPKPLRLTTDPAWDGNPAFSPDGQSIAFSRVLDDRVAILLVPAIGGPERLLAEFRPANALALSWFPDGKWIATDGLALISVETGEIRKLTALPTESFRDYTPAISPDGRTVAFSRGEGVFEIYLLGLTPDLKPKGEPKQLTHLSRQSYRPTWTADGRDIIFASQITWESGLWRMSVLGSGDPKPLFAGSDRDSSPAISRQGNRLVFARSVSDANIHRLSLSEAGEGKAIPKRFLSSSRDDVVPKYSPDGKRIAFESTRTGPRGIWVSDADGSNLVDVFSQTGSSAGSPAWAPDGQRLAFASNMDGPEAIYVVRVTGGKPIRLTFGPISDDVPSWSKDGRWIYYASSRSGKYPIWKVPAQGGEAVQVTGCDDGYDPIESRDGKFLYFYRGQALWKIPISGGAANEILPSVTLFNYELMDDGIYFIPPPDKSGKAELKFLSFATNAVKTITTLPGQISLGLAVSPDRRWVLYATNDVTGSDLMLVENFR